MATITKVTEELYQKTLRGLREAAEKKAGKPLKQLREERNKRFVDAIQMKVPDQVPVIVGGPYLACKVAGLPYSAYYYDAVAWKNAYAKMIVDFDPDASGIAGGTANSGLVLETLDAKNVRWPGGTLTPDLTNQAVDDEYMKEDEYDLFLEDPSDFLLRYYLPRVYGALAPLAKLPSLTDRFTGFPGMTPLFTREEFRQVARGLSKAGQEQIEWRQLLANFDQDLISLGFGSLPQGGGGPGGPPFDVVANSLRGWKGIITDMFRQPEKLIATCEKVMEMQTRRMVPADPKKGVQLGGGGAIHRGSDRFMSKRQFETFYWPTWKKSMMKAIEMGYIVSIFAEGFCENRFEYLMELPKGKAMIRFTDTDMAKAKAALGNRFCLMGSVPLTLLQMGSPPEVEEYCKKLIKVCAKGGGWIMRSDTDYIQDAKPENVKAMVDATRKYGVY